MHELAPIWWRIINIRSENILGWPRNLRIRIIDLCRPKSSDMFIVGRAVAGIGGSGLLIGLLTILAASAPLDKRPCASLSLLKETIVC